MSNIFTMPSIPSTTSVISTYTAFAASSMLVRTVLNEVQTMTAQLIPQKLQDKIMASLGSLFRLNSCKLTLIIDEYNGFTINEIYQASQAYLSTRITPSVDQLKVSKAPREKNFTVTINKGQRITDEFEGIQVAWEFSSTETQTAASDYSDSTEKSERKLFLLCFNKEHKDAVLNVYLPYVLERSKALKEENKAIKLYSLFGGEYYEGPWGSINLDHPSTFDTIAMDPRLKQEVMDDLDRFVIRREFYRRVGRPWKRGYLLYGPPGTGKSSLIAAMANYLKFNIYDLELTSISSNSELRRLLTSTGNRSILVIEDIDCSIKLQDRQNGENNPGDSQLTLSGLLNFIDGLWSSCGDEKIIVFTTNYKDKLDPALLRPGRMDMHIHMSYCTTSGFKILAFNYLKIKTHCLFTEIEKLIEEVEVTPAEVAEELMKGGDVDLVLKGLQGFLQGKKEMKRKEKQSLVEIDMEVTENDNEKERQEMEKGSQGRVKKNKSKRTRRGKGRLV
ncbi:AAA-ATPase At3g50940 [Ricinus communis]|uniref:ATP binding protein, putative n=1 Tax=Ricinus communis TaxID=3988 RepID=B9RMH6_RICCO|nr:AAA-ATPase At3g50940 [Ricinus communis]EEF47499.1 ATP binding protein, putative [Ricinus communis]|eukprot:XP_002514945.1 AAA-ATPase At3g50940 [Ricinus communis]